MGLDAIPLEPSRGQRAGFVRRLHRQDALARAIGGVLSLSPVAAWMVGSGGVLGLIGVSVAVIWAGLRRPYLPVGWFWYLGTLVPVIGLVQVGSQPMADRYTYVPLIGLFIMVAWGVPDLLARWPLRSIALPAAAALVISACAITAWGQVQYWENSTALWAHALEVTTGNYLAHNNLGNDLAKQGRFDEAMAHYSEALRIKPDYAFAHNNLGHALANQGRVSEAIAHYSEALRIEPGYADAHNNLGIVLADQGKLDEAIAHYSEALRIKPDFADAHNNLGIALAKHGKADEAIHEFLEALRIKPDYPEAHNNLGVVLASEGRVSEAISQYSEALRLKPDYQEARRSLEDLTSRGKKSEPGTP